jgi:undecaprenyl-diphosphatase
MLDPILLLKATIIGVVEGLTEFLPISSTAHIVIAQRALGFIDEGEVFAVVIQLGAILAVCAYFWKRIWHLATSLHCEAASRRFVATLAVACVPAGIAGVTLNTWLETHVFGGYALAIIAVTSAVGGVGILLIERFKPVPRFGEAATIPWRTAIGIGFLQVLAMIPGVSRSGASILGGMCLGVDRRAATEFSFFLAIPLMLGASGLKLVKHRADITSDQLGVIFVGSVVSFIVALAVVHWLLRYVATHDFRVFAWYRIGLGVVLAALLAVRWLPLGGA